MGFSHVTLTGATWAAIVPPFCVAIGHPMSGAEVLASTGTAAAASLWPDWDHDKATLSYSMGPMSAGIARTVHQLSGGHRRMTHSLFACLGAGVATGLLWVVPDIIGGFSLPTHWAVLVFVFFLAFTLARMLQFAAPIYWILGALRVPGRGSRWLSEIIYLAVAAALTAVVKLTVPGTWWWLPVAVGAGCLLHCVQDACTEEQVPWFWRPISRKPLHLVSIGATGDPPEIVLALVLGVGGGIWILWATLSGAPWWSIRWLR